MALTKQNFIIYTSKQLLAGTRCWNEPTCWLLREGRYLIFMSGHSQDGHLRQNLSSSYGENVQIVQIENLAINHTAACGHCSPSLHASCQNCEAHASLIRIISTFYYQQHFTKVFMTRDIFARGNINSIWCHFSRPPLRCEVIINNFIPGPGARTNSHLQINYPQLSILLSHLSNLEPNKILKSKFVK